MTRATGTALAALLCLPLLAACGDGSRTADAAPADVDTVIAALEQVPGVERSIRLTEDNDPAEMIGRGGGYSDGAVFVDAGRSCPQPGIDCGATLEAWGDNDAATRRSEEISALHQGMQGLGSERHFVRDGLLLRVDRDLPARQVRRYGAAFTG